MTQADDQRAHQGLEDLRALARDWAPERVAQINELETAFGPQGALKITGTAEENRNEKLTAGYSKAGDWHVKDLLQNIKTELGGKPTAQQTALQTGLQDAIKARPQLVDDLETAMKNDPSLANKLQRRYIDNPDGVKAQLAELTKPGANISNIVNGISRTPTVTAAAPAAAPAPAAPAGGRGNGAGPGAAPAGQPPAAQPPAAQPPAAQPATASTGPFDKAKELANVDPSVREGVGKLFEAMMSHKEVADAFNPLKDEEKRDLIKHLGEAAKADPNFLKDATDIVTNKPQLIGQYIDNFADDPAKAFRDAKTQEVTPPGGPGGRRGGPDPNNPLSGLMGMISERIGPMLGRIASVFMNIFEGVLGFFEKMFGGGTHGVSSNPGNPVLAQAFPGAQMGPDGPVAAPGAGARPAPSPLVRGPGMGG